MRLWPVVAAVGEAFSPSSESAAVVIAAGNGCHRNNLTCFLEDADLESDVPQIFFVCHLDAMILLVSCSKPPPPSRLGLSDEYGFGSDVSYTLLCFYCASSCFLAQQTTSWRCTPLACKFLTIHASRIPCYLSSFFIVNSPNRTLFSSYLSLSHAPTMWSVCVFFSLRAAAADTVLLCIHTSPAIEAM